MDLDGDGRVFLLLAMPQVSEAVSDNPMEPV